MKNVSLLCILTLQGKEKGSVLVMSVKKSIQTFDMLKRYDVNPRSHPEKLHIQLNFSGRANHDERTPYFVLSCLHLD